MYIYIYEHFIEIYTLRVIVYDIINCKYNVTEYYWYIQTKLYENNHK